MKKCSIFVVAAVLCAGLLGGCGQPAQTASSSAPASSEESASSASEAASAESSASVSEAASTELPKKFILGLDAAFPPMGFTNETNDIVGVDIDVAKAVCEKLGMEFEAKPISWDAKEMELNTGKITCIWNGLTVTPERKDAFLLSQSYMNNTQYIVVAADSAIQTKAELTGKVVAAQSDSSGLSALQSDEIYTSIDGGAAKEYGDYVAALDDLAAGRCDAVVMDSVVANYYATTKPIRFLKEEMGAEEYAIAFKKGDTALCEAVEKALSELAAEGKLAEISKQWFGRDDMFIIQ